MIKHYKYPRTYHLPWSPNLQNDDRLHPNINIFENREVIVTSKMDGENTNMYCDRIHARSLDSGYHISREWIKNLHGQIKHEIPNNMRICGENLFAKHSIYYTNLDTYFMVFSIWEDDYCLSWDDTIEYCNLFKLKTVSVLYRGIWDENLIKSLVVENEEEGYVVRIADGFVHDFDKRFFSLVAKYVRKNHIQTEQNWMYQPMIKNQLKHI